MTLLRPAPPREFIEQESVASPDPLCYFSTESRLHFRAVNPLPRKES